MEASLGKLNAETEALRSAREKLDADSAAAVASRDQEAKDFRLALDAEGVEASKRRDEEARALRSAIDLEREQLRREQAELETKLSEVEHCRLSNEEAAKRIASRTVAMLEQEDSMAKREVSGLTPVFAYRTLFTAKLKKLQ